MTRRYAFQSSLSRVVRYSWRASEQSNVHQPFDRLHNLDSTAWTFHASAKASEMAPTTSSTSSGVTPCHSSRVDNLAWTPERKSPSSLEPGLIAHLVAGTAIPGAGTETTRGAWSAGPRSSARMR